METIHTRLRAWRTGKSRALNVPSFFVLSNAYLSGLATKAPTTLQELATCPGMREKKLEQFGAEIIEVIAGCVAEGLPSGVQSRDTSSITTIEGGATIRKPSELLVFDCIVKGRSMLNGGNYLVTDQDGGHIALFALKPDLLEYLASASRWGAIEDGHIIDLDVQDNFDKYSGFVAA